MAKVKFGTPRGFDFERTVASQGDMRPRPFDREIARFNLSLNLIWNMLSMIESEPFPGVKTMSTAIVLTIDDLEALPDDGNRYELIDGELYVSRAPGFPHQRVVVRLVHLLETYSEDVGKGVVIGGPGVIFGKHDSVIPYVVFVRQERRDIISNRGLTAAPDLVVEILSPGEPNADRDRKMKLQLYSREGAGEYWIVDPEARMLALHRPVDGVLRLVALLEGEDRLTSPILPGFDIPLSSLFK